MLTRGRLCLAVLILLVIGFTVTASVKRLKGDLDGDGQVAFSDFVLFAQNFGKAGGATFDPEALVDTSVVNYRDTIAVTVVDTFWGWRVVRDTVERVVYEYESERPKLYSQIIVLPDGWDNPDTSGTVPLTPEIIQSLCEDVRALMAEKIEYPLDSDIVVYTADYGPRVLYDRSPVGDYTGAYKIALKLIDNGEIKNRNHKYPVNFVYVDVAFQFAHEYAHILQNYYRAEREGKQLWFQEALCSMASIYVLLKLERIWASNPPAYLKDEDQPRQKRFWITAYLGRRAYYGSVPQGLLPMQGYLIRWYNKYYQSLEADGNQRIKNRLVALALLDIFQEDPEAWNILRYLNSNRYEEGTSFREYLTSWYYLHAPKVATFCRRSD